MENEMWVIANISGIIVAKFRSAEQIDKWIERTGLDKVNLSISFNSKLVNENEWVRPGY